MTRAQQNEAIAEILGFKKGTLRTLVAGMHQTEETYWMYPDAWESHAHGYPSWYLPDFVGMLEEMRRLQDLGKPLDYGTEQPIRYHPLPTTE